MKTDNQSALELQWAKQAQDMRDAADKLPDGPAKEQLVRNARQFDTASRMNRWCSSKELKPPT